MFTLEHLDKLKILFYQNFGIEKLLYLKTSFKHTTVFLVQFYILPNRFVDRKVDSLKKLKQLTTKHERIKLEIQGKMEESIVEEKYLYPKQKLLVQETKEWKLLVSLNFIWFYVLYYMYYFCSMFYGL